MGTFSFHNIPQFLRLRRSHSQPANPTPAPVSHSPGLDGSCALASCFLDGRCVPEHHVNVMAGAPRPSCVGNSMSHQTGAGRILIDRAMDDFSGQSLPALQPVAPIGVVDLKSAPILCPQTSIAQQPVQLPCQHQNKGMFHQAHNFSAMGNFIDGNVGSITYIATPSNQFMKEFLNETIPGAAFDSSARDPPPRCHPGTRLAILARCIDFISNCDSTKRMRWIVGAAGVGKTAIMQNVAESLKLPVTSHASVFFSINGRNDGTKAIITLSYQFAAKSATYRQIIEDEIMRNPSLLQSSMPVQFEKFIVQPFIHNRQLNSAGRVLIIIDGLDECTGPQTQLELLRLISNFCIAYSSSPIVWLIASRPEAHITSFFSRTEVIPTYEKEKILVDSDDARTDVERFLRNELMEIKKASDSLDPQWPDERDLWKLANASGGLFAYAHTIIRYVGDSRIGGPVSQLSDVLHILDNHPLPGIPREEHPMALLDALYARILSNCPLKAATNSRKILLALASNWDSDLRPTSGPHSTRGDFILLCNWLNMTSDDAYTAINNLRSVLRVPRRDKAHKEQLKPFHKSFIDYISDFTRSGFSSDIQREARQLRAQCAFRVLKESPTGIDYGRGTYRIRRGTFVRGPGTGDGISLTWLAGGGFYLNDITTRLGMYKLAMEEVVVGIEHGDPTFQNVFCVSFLATRFKGYNNYFPRDQLRDLVFDESRRHEFTMHNLLRQIPLKAINVDYIFGKVKLQFHRLATVVANVSDPWDLSCEHDREGEWEEGKDQNWTTTFSSFQRSFCRRRLKHQLETSMSQFPNHTALIFFTSTGACCVEFGFVDEEDGMSEWKYWFWCEFTQEERKKYGSSL